VADGRLELARETGESDQLARAADAIDRCQELVDDLLVMAEVDSEVSEMVTVELADAAEHSWRTIETGPDSGCRLSSRLPRHTAGRSP
jgi:signal transduction histidine kinase